MTALLMLTLSGGVLAWFMGHQASHVHAVGAGHANLPGGLLLLISLPNKLYWLVSWLVMIGAGFKAHWWYSVVAIVGGFIVQAFLVAGERRAGLTEKAWAISLTGILVNPVALAGMLVAVALIPELP